MNSVKLHRKKYMRTLLRLTCIGIASLGVTATGNGQVLLTFDDLPTTPSTQGNPGTGVIPNGYGGLDWSNFGVIDGVEAQHTYGYYTGVVSPSNVAFNEYGNSAYVAKPGGLFDLHSAFLTAALNLSRPLNIQIQGFLGATMLYNNTYTVNNSGPTLIDLNYDGVDIVTFTSSPGQQFAMDNLTVTVPEPSIFTLFLLGTLLFRWCILHRSAIPLLHNQYPQ